MRCFHTIIKEHICSDHALFKSFSWRISTICIGQVVGPQQHLQEQAAEGTEAALKKQAEVHFTEVAELREGGTKGTEAALEKQAEVHFAEVAAQQSRWEVEKSKFREGPAKGTEVALEKQAEVHLAEVTAQQSRWEVEKAEFREGAAKGTEAALEMQAEEHLAEAREALQEQDEAALAEEAAQQARFEVGKDTFLVDAAGHCKIMLEMQASELL